MKMLTAKKLLVISWMMVGMVGIGYCKSNKFIGESEIREYKQKYTGMITFSIEVTTSAVCNSFFITLNEQSIVYDEFLNKTVRELLKDGIDIIKKSNVEVIYKDMKGKVKDFGKEVK